jgi:cellulose synthase/poly-beta-1,6-N-acetylglucosamine synthase-like glycosyltransferase
VLDLVGGWDAGTAEDLDMTQRLKQYFGRHPSWRIVFDPRVVGHTDVPATFRDFCKQRLRWDGDLYYIFVRKYRRSLRPRLLGWRTFLAQVVMAVLLQLAMPFLILAYSAWLFVRVEPGLVLAILGLVYLAYLALLVVQFALYCLAVSDRPREDARYFLWLPLYPLFAWCARINSAVALLHEIFNRGHLDSAMAPWWVLRKTKF